MSSLRSNLKGIFSLAVLLLHLLVAGLGPMSDAAVERRGLAFDFVHVESEESRHPAPGHDHLFCQVCRAVDHAGPPTGGIAWIAHLRFTATASTLAPLLHPHRPAPTSGLGSRAPPVS